MFASKKSKDFLKNYLAFLINSLNMVIREKCKELQKDRHILMKGIPLLDFRNTQNICDREAECFPIMVKYLKISLNLLNTKTDMQFF